MVSLGGDMFGRLKDVCGILCRHLSFAFPCPVTMVGESFDKLCFHASDGGSAPGSDAGVAIQQARDVLQNDRRCYIKALKRYL